VIALTAIFPSWSCVTSIEPTTAAEARQAIRVRRTVSEEGRRHGRSRKVVDLPVPSTKVDAPPAIKVLSATRP
jgi:hypothetical protein